MYRYCQKHNTRNIRGSFLRTREEGDTQSQPVSEGMQNQAECKSICGAITTPASPSSAGGAGKIGLLPRSSSTLLIFKVAQLSFKFYFWNGRRLDHMKRKILGVRVGMG